MVTPQNYCKTPHKNSLHIEENFLCLFGLDMLYKNYENCEEKNHQNISHSIQNLIIKKYNYIY